MDLMTTVKLRGGENIPHIGKRFSVCTISKKNLVAFSAPRCFKLKKGPEPARKQPQDEKLRLSDW